MSDRQQPRDAAARVRSPVTREVGVSYVMVAAAMSQDNNDLFRLTIEGDNLLGQTCLGCGLKAALFIVLGRFVGVCPSCAAARVDALSAERGELPEWLDQFRLEAMKEATFQRQQLENPFELRWDDFFRCADCDKVIQERDARYSVDLETQSSPPYCQQCYNRRAAR